MTTIDNGGTAFPGTQYANGIQPTGFSRGMTLRDYFAAKAMQGLCAGLEAGDKAAMVPELAYMMADAMLKARAG